ncbi:uncharacterized protein LOC143469517 isoform X2 [Clavelina lepadiformis]|uniref:uncharacterized protein LOC143469517 isoform X2 n=1 Tax=Clavelina lepadiformis TaxID=159417 RepID=UPI004041AF50
MKKLGSILHTSSSVGLLAILLVVPHAICQVRVSSFLSAGPPRSKLTKDVMVRPTVRHLTNAVFFNLEETLERYRSLSQEIAREVENFHPYIYDSLADPVTHIRDGGRDMYDFGNMVKVFEDQTATEKLTYGKTYRFPRYSVSTLNTHPFLTLVWIKNKDGEKHNYTLQVTGDFGADGRGRISRTNGSVTTFNALLKYHTMQIYSSRDASVCEVYFTIATKSWESTHEDTFEVVSFPQTTLTAINEVRVTGRPQNLLLGYILLSKSDSDLVTENEVRGALNQLLNLVVDEPIATTKISRISSGRTSTEVFGTTLLENATTFHATTSQSLPSTSPTSITSSITTKTQPTIRAFNFAEIMKKIMAIADVIANGIDNFHYHRYDAVTHPQDHIRDGGRDLFDNGNIVKLYEDNNQDIDSLIYGNNYRFLRYKVSAIASHPFVTVAWISNSNRERHSYTINVSGDLGADGRGNIRITHGQILGRNSLLRYHVFQVYDSGDASLCEVYFTISSQLWMSRPGEDFDIISFSTSTLKTNNAVRLSGRPQNVLLAYMLLSKNQSEFITDEEVRRSLSVFLKAVLPGELLEEALDRDHTTTNQVKTTGQTNFPNPGSSTAFNEASDAQPPSLDEIFRRASSVESDLPDIIPFWHNYTYDGETFPRSAIQDGGSDLFDTGNMVRFYEGSDVPDKQAYNTVRRESTYSVRLGGEGHPFLALALIGNASNTVRSYTMQVDGNFGADGRGEITTNSGSVKEHGSIIHYHSFQVHGAGDPSVCEVYFAMTHQGWSSNTGKFFVLRFSTETNEVSNAVRLVGDVSNVLVGYALLSGSGGRQITDEMIRLFLRRLIFRIIDQPAINSSTTTDHMPSVYTAGPNVSQALESIARIEESLRNSYSNWFSYSYDGVDNRSILDGLNDMYDNGNKVFLRQDNEELIHAVYNQSYSFPGFQFETRAGNPFVALLSVDIDQDNYTVFEIQVSGNPGSDGNGDISTFSGNISVGNFRVEYHTFQIYNAGRDPTICEVYFLIWNMKEWRSRRPASFDVRFSADSRNLDNYARITGSPSRVLLGYTLLSRYPTSIIEDFAVQRILTNMVTAIITQNDGPSAEPPDLTTVGSIYQVTELTIQATSAGSRLQTDAYSTNAMTTPQVFKNSHSEYKSNETTSYEGSTAASQTTAIKSGSMSTTLSIPLNEEEDLEFLPSCSVKQIIHGMFRCEQIFALPSTYRGPASCLEQVDSALRCIGNQLLQCRLGGGRNKLDSMQIPNFNSKSILSFIHDLTSFGGTEPNKEINAFCFHAGLRLPYPYHISIAFSMCENGVLDEIIDKAKDFYYSFAWARDKNDICRAFENIKQWTLQTLSNRCQWDEILQLNLPQTDKQYIRRAVEIALQTMQTLRSQSCSRTSYKSRFHPGESVAVLWDSFPGFACSGLYTFK